MNLILESRRTLQRLLENTDLSGLSKKDQQLFNQRLEENFVVLFSLLHQVYGQRYDFYYFLQQLVHIMKSALKERSSKLKQQDIKRAKEPDWYKNESMLGLSCYVDLFAGDLVNLEEKIPYLTSLGITYLHLMPLYKSPQGDSDGGYAVSDYRQTDEKLGSIKDLKRLSDALSKAGINLVLDFVFNHTSDEHQWAKEAQKGNTEYQEFYWMFDDKTLPDMYEQNLREIFPQVRKGNFTWSQTANKWVWTTFNNFQWDLNYSNPAVFNAIADEMFFLANLGCDALRLDALAFIWKEMGTSCENQPKAHLLIQAFNRCLKIVAPSVVFKSEAIVHPDEVIKYIDKDECQLSYNPLLMALIWNSLATRKTKLLTQSMRTSFDISGDCAWVNYARSHDDIGWTFDDTLAVELGMNGNDHRHFLNQFYTGRFEGSFASGVAFGENAETGDCRVCGSLASLAGLEKAIEHGDTELIDHAVARILMIHSIILSIGGIPLLYSGDELGLLNNYEYQDDPSKAHDGRWVHRLSIKDSDVNNAKKIDTPNQRIAQELEHLILIRKHNKILGNADTDFIEVNNEHVFAYTRRNDQGQTLLALANFSENVQCLDGKVLTQLNASRFMDLISGENIYGVSSDIQLLPYQVMWLIASNEIKA
ncbi:alpha-amylase family glycosyl hydrolase [Paraglaciecola sp. MB-3u-78]|uniref:alpha-amylase family glycosyl hydrolase n=1 Tax=Paraglaciecola sp. MB-3u-78 TaxID=2058332 RepID=UPI000C348BD3|nr:alpha-amylase family glycosyl hydrolase [Paraglaciecola sp. MB-3u-78]PKG98458.1 amylosucrase [Paraglaciecola sp. MB-3u-78]